MPRILGATLVGLSVVSVIQTAREVKLWEFDREWYVEGSPRGRAFAFAGHMFSVADDQPVSAKHGEAQYEGLIQPLIDGRPLAASSRARVRRGRNDLGRYHGWLDAWIFRERSGGDSTLWLARRLQPTDADGPRFEVITITSDGASHVGVFRAWQLAVDYRLLRATQFVSQGTWTVLPLALGDVAGFFPVLLLIFPLGTFVVGMRLLRNSGRSGGNSPSDVLSSVETSADARS